MSSSSPCVSRKGQLFAGSTEEDPGWGVPTRIWVTKRAKNVEKERKVKNPVGKKYLLKTVALTVKLLTKKLGKSKATESSQGRAQSWWRPTRAWEVRVECGWHRKVAGKRKNLQWGKQQPQQQPTSQKPPGGSPKQRPSQGVLLSQLLIIKIWLQKCYWYYLYIWYCSSYGGDLDM